MGTDIHRGLELWQPRVYNEWEALRAGAWFGAAGSNTHQLSADRLYAAYVAAPRDVVVDRVGVSVYAADSGKTLWLGLYADDDRDGCPDRLVLDAGTVDVSTAGDKEIAVDVQLHAGSYYIAFLGDGTPQLSANTAPRTRTPLGMIAAKPSLYVQTWWVNRDAGPLPELFPSGVTADYREYQVAMRVACVL